MGNVIRTVLVISFIASTIGCRDSPPRQEKDDAATTFQSKTSKSRVAIEPGLYTAGPEHESVSEILASASARIGLDVHQGIEWYDQESAAWKTLDNIQKLEPLLYAVSEKSLIVISTGKAMWDKSDEYIVSIVGFAKEAGYDTTVVTAAHSEGIIVSQVVHHND